MPFKENILLQFILSACLLVGTFSGSYYAKRSMHSSSPISDVEQIVSSGTNDKEKLSTASSIASSILLTEPKNCNALMLSALALQRQGLLPEAIQQYEKLNIESENFNVLSHLNLGSIFEALGKNSDAEAQYRLVLSQNNRIPLVWSNLIKLLLKQQKNTEASKELATALELLPHVSELQALKNLVNH
jgi:tetratricopeptide (TPR) repeat protein